MIKLRSYQLQALRDTVAYIKKQKGNPVIAMPTGTGKSLLIAALIRYYHAEYGKRILVLTHVKELIEQNYKATAAFCPPPVDMGIYSAGLKRREADNAVTFAGIASVHNKIDLLGHRDFVIIDECHLVPATKNTMYRKLLDKLNPGRVIGLSATPYRLDNGPLTKGGVFDAICHDSTKLEDFSKYIDDGYLSPLIACETDEQLSLEGVHRVGSDYVKSELQAAVDKEEITHRAVAELVERGKDRKHWLIFSTGIKHNHNIVAELHNHGIEATSIDSKCSNNERDERIAGFKAGEYRAIVNANILTTGFDFPAIDLIGMLRPMCSPGLWVQSLGRGTRPDASKDNCLVLDYAGNTRRLGPINDPVIPYRTADNKVVKKPALKKCAKCSALVPPATKLCACGYVFPALTKAPDKLKERASTEALIVTKKSVKVLNLNVDRINFIKHKKEGGLDSLKVVYYCAGKVIREWLCFDHYEKSFPYKKAKWFWWASAKTKPPCSVDEALERKDECRKPREIVVDITGKYPNVLERKYDGTETQSKKKNAC